MLSLSKDNSSICIFLQRRETLSCGVSAGLSCLVASGAKMASLQNVTILILDDNPLVLKLARALLEREGATVLTSSSWIEFNHALASNEPDVILLDINLPSIKGNRLSEVLKSQSERRDIPIILISDLPERSLEELLPASGADAWLRKPLTRDKLIDSIVALLPLP